VSPPPEKRQQRHRNIFINKELQPALGNGIYSWFLA
jgi:hypothetical protein